MATNPILNGTYDLSGIISKDAIDNPALWTAKFNILMGGWFVFACLIIFGIVLYLIARTNDQATDTKALVYAGLISSVIGIFLFVVNISAYPDLKLITWVQLVPFLVLTGIFIFLDKTNRTF